MIKGPFKILLVEDNPGDARLIKEMLADAPAQDLTVEWVSRLADGLERLRQNKFDLVLLDLGLPDSSGLETFINAYAQAPQVPFVVLSGLSDETLALTAVRQGAQDYLFKNEISSNQLVRAIRYATERKQAELALEAERKKLYTVLNSLPTYVYLKKADFSIHFANRRFTEIFGEPGNRLCYEVLLGRNEPCENCRSLEVLKTKAPQKGEWISPFHGRTYEVYHYPFCIEEDLLVLTLGLDITERKQAEEAIKDREEQLTALYENAPLIMMLVDGERRVRRMNKLAEQFAGASNDDVIGRRGGEALGCLHALDDPEGCGYGPYCQDCTVRRTVIETFETGRSHHQVEACLPFVHEGKPRGVTFLLCTARLAVRGQPQVLVTIQDITKRKQAEEQLRVSEKELRFLASQLLTAQERERERISRELHDELGQSLLVLKLQAGHIEKQLDQDQTGIKKDCHSLMHQFDRLVGEVRRLARDLSPTMVRDLGLASALQRLIQDFSRHYGIQAEIDLIRDLDGLFSREAQVNIYRIFQESLTNIGKYAEASQLSADIKLEDGCISFQIADNGKGFRVEEVWGRDPSRRGLGLMAMEERARMLGGTLKIRSAEGQGTQLVLMIPVSNSRAGRTNATFAVKPWRMR